MANFAGQLVSTRADKKMAFADNIFLTKSGIEDKSVDDMFDGMDKSIKEFTAVTVDEKGPTTDYVKTYVIKQNAKQLAEISIPKDLVVTEGSVVRGTWNGDTFTESETGTEKALKLVIANQSNPVYIKLDDLVDKLYTEGNGVDISNTNVISAKKSGSSESFLKIDGNGISIEGVQSAIDNAVQNGVADKLTNISVNGVNGTVSNQIASVTVKGDDVDVADAYTATVYPSPFEDKVTANAAHVVANDKIDDAFGKVEKTISLLAGEIIDNETVVATTVGKLSSAAGTLGYDGAIGYQTEKDANYISAATSVHDATVLLDTAVKAVAVSAANGLTSVTDSDAISVGVKSSGSQQISLKLDSSIGDNALEIIAEQGLYLSNTIDCGTY